MELPSPWTSLLFFFGGTVCSDNAPKSLDGDWDSTSEADMNNAIFPFPFPEPEVVSALLRPPVGSIPGIYTPQDTSPVYHTVMSVSSSVGIYFNSSDLTAWSKKISWQSSGELMKS
jgi:hypothetical protein